MARLQPRLLKSAIKTTTKSLRAADVGKESGAASIPPGFAPPPPPPLRPHGRGAACARPLPIQRVRAVPLKPHPGRQEADKEIQN